MSPLQLDYARAIISDLKKDPDYMHYSVHIVERLFVERERLLDALTALNCLAQEDHRPDWRPTYQQSDEAIAFAIRWADLPVAAPTEAAT